MFLGSNKEINRLISKGMSNICLIVPIEKDFDFLSLKNLFTCQFLANSNWRRYN